MPNTTGVNMDKKVRDTVLDTLSIVVMFYTIITGVCFIFLGSDEVSNESTYQRMEDLMSIKVWGLLFCLSAIFHLIAVVIEYRRLQYLFFMIAGFTGFSLMLLYATASFDTSAYKINAFRYLLFAGVNITIALKGVKAWREEKIL
ncbi:MULTISPECIES: hypothetical protein [Priestia]|uniref:hypothetical protein n=1 Tax=Priestia TaxID=2800373 RepID=UPI002109DEB9|nr:MULTISPECIES: hypothetical protein [Priestia]MED4098368.1 hypothetical protein [Priestia megaterium]